MPKTVYHTWRERTADGPLRTVRAHCRGGHWRLASKEANEEDWTPHDPVSTEDLRSLRDVLWRKYQRRRVAWEAVAQIDAMLEERGAGKAES